MTRPAATAPQRARWDLLRLDSTAGLLAGALVLALSPWLAGLYALPRALLIAMGVANLAYGTYSGLLARRVQRPYGLIVLLVAANASWAVLCGVAAAHHAGTASVFGLAHLLGEGLFVGGLAAVEWRARERLLVAA